MAKKRSRTVKPSVQDRSLNLQGDLPNQGAPFQEQDPKRRLGNFTTTGEHARQGGRSKGIVGHSKHNSKANSKKKS